MALIHASRALPRRWPMAFSSGRSAAARACRGADLAEEAAGGFAAVAHQLAEDQVVGLDAGGALVDGGDARESRQCWAAPVPR